LLEDQLKKAERGDADTQFNFGWMYASGPGVTQDYTRAVNLWTKVAEMGHAFAQNK
jgi:uncharacterized protein